MSDMKHDFRTEPDGTEATRFREWLEGETTGALKRDYGDGEATKATVFLFVNRAYEAHMPEEEIAGLFAKCVVRAGYREEDEEAVFSWLDAFGQIAKGVHGTE